MLLEAVALGCTNMVGLVLSLGADVNMPDKFSFPPLSHAVYSNKPAIVSMLVDRGASLKFFEGKINHWLISEAAANQNIYPAVLRALLGDLETLNPSLYDRDVVTALLEVLNGYM